MSIRFVLVPYADGINRLGKKKKGFFPRSSSRETLSVMDIVTEMEEGNVARAIADRAVIEGFMYKMFEALKNGYIVKVDGYGFFKPVLSIRKGGNTGDPKEKDIVFGKIDFTLTIEGKERLKDTQFVIKSNTI